MAIPLHYIITMKYRVVKTLIGWVVQNTKTSKLYGPFMAKTEASSIANELNKPGGTYEQKKYTIG